MEDMWENDELHLIIKESEGGNLEPIAFLIDQILYSKVKTVVSAEGFLISAAAYLYFRLLIESKENCFIEVSTPQKSIPIVYHKPRVSDGEYYGFSSDLKGIPEKQSKLSEMLKLEELTDTLFYQIADLLNWRDNIEVPYHNEEGRLKHKFHHLKESYETYKDVVFMYGGTDE